MAFSTYKRTRNVAAIDALLETKIGNDWDIKALVHRASQDTFMGGINSTEIQQLKSSVVAERLKENRCYRVVGI